MPDEPKPKPAPDPQPFDPTRLHSIGHDAFDMSQTVSSEVELDDVLDARRWEVVRKRLPAGSFVRVLSPNWTAEVSIEWNEVPAPIVVKVLRSWARAKRPDAGDDALPSDAKIIFDPTRSKHRAWFTHPDLVPAGDERNTREEARQDIVNAARYRKG